MNSRLTKSPQVWKLATDLGLKPKDDPVSAIVEFARKQMGQFLREFPCSTLQESLDMAAARLDTHFIEIRSDADLGEIKSKYLTRSEIGFADLELQLTDDVYAITFRLLNPKKHDRKFVSLIDFRGTKAWRCYFSKWHELAHLFTLTPQMRLKFCRSHSIANQKDPEEAVMDVIAGKLGFLPEIVQKHASGEISFNKIQELKDRLCPEASNQASVIGFTHSWPTPCVLIDASPALRKQDRLGLNQSSFEFKEQPQPVLRAVKISTNEPARNAKLKIFPNMRIPQKSVINRVFTNSVAYDEAIEDLAWWNSSDGTRLPRRPVKVSARLNSGSVQALVVPV
ncbi:MAG: hypothetical protein DMG65_10005 [Candidatus Angelobacter sp. Gp1-AA117]|nr:MAG: hypothetical protein DMG65_10005 [Candidatus Angelobacter sp. Gp1-AA117]